MAELLPHLILQILHFYGQPAKLCQDPGISHPSHLRGSNLCRETHIYLERHLVDKDLVAKKVSRTQQHVLALKMAGHTLS